MVNKYCMKNHPLIVQAKYGSLFWKKMAAVRELVEHQIWWQVRSGNASLWFDNWTFLVALYYVIPESTEVEEIAVKIFADANG